MAVAFPGGVYLAVLLLSEPRNWPRWTMLAFTIDFVTGFWLCQADLTHALFDSSGHIAGMLAAAWLVRRVCDSPFRFDTPRGMLALIIFIAVPGAAVSAGMDTVLTAHRGHAVTITVWLLNWTAYILGGLIAAPLALTVSQGRAAWARMDGWRWLEASALMIFLMVVIHFVFNARLPLVFLLLPPILWGALRFGILGTVLAVTLLAVMALHYTASSLGSYAAAARGPIEGGLMVQTFLVLASAGALLMVAVTTHRRLVLAELRRAHDNLEAQVIARTAALRESEQRLRTLLDAIPDQVRMKDVSGRYVMINHAAQARFGLPGESIIGKTVFDLRPAAAAAAINAADKQALAADSPVRLERNSYVSPGTWQETILAPIRDRSGAVTGLVSIARDITERKHAELETLREREAQYRTLVEQASDVIYRTDLRGYFTYFNSDAALHAAGYTRQDLIGRHYLEIVHPDYRAQTEAFYRRVFQERLPSSYHEFPVVTKDGRTIWVGQHVNVFIENGRVIYHQAVCRDISERVAAQQALRDTNEKLRRLSARQEELLEMERTRIAHDLHDGIGQSLNLVRIKIESAIGDPGAGGIAPQLREITRIIDETNAAIRTLEYDLSPPVLRQLGLAPALDWLADEMLKDYGLQVGLSDDGEPKPLPELSRVIAFRLVRELLINVVRHAGVGRAHVDQQRTGDALVITVSDEGTGFDAATVSRGLGLVSVRERIGTIGGNVVIHSAPDEGTVVTLSLPLA